VWGRWTRNSRFAHAARTRHPYNGSISLIAGVCKVMAHPAARYRIYLLSVWREDEESETGSPKLRFRLEDPRTGERHGFDGPDVLVAFLQASLTDRGENDHIAKST